MQRFESARRLLTLDVIISVTSLFFRIAITFMREQHSYSTEAIVLKRTDLGEADRILTLFTPTRGKYHAIAKGVRRPISKKAGHLELLKRTQLQVALGRNLDIVTQAEGRENFSYLRTELWHMTCGFYLAELIDRFLEEQTPHHDIYNLLLETLRVLDRDAHDYQQRMKSGTQGTQVPVPTPATTVVPVAPTSPVSPIQEHGRTNLLMRYFEIHLLSAIGYQPAFHSCAHCSNELQAVENGFAPSLGGALCPQCSRFWAYPLSLNALKVLRLLQRSKWSDVPRLRLDARLYREIETVMHGLLRFHLERDLKSWSFLEMLNVRP